MRASQAGVLASFRAFSVMDGSLAVCALNISARVDKNDRRCGETVGNIDVSAALTSPEQLASTNDRIQASSALASLCSNRRVFVVVILNEAIFEKFSPLYKSTHSANGPSGRTRRKRIISRSQPWGAPLSSSQGHTECLSYPNTYDGLSRMQSGTMTRQQMTMAIVDNAHGFPYSR